MAETVTLEEVAALAAKLTLADRRLLVKKLQKQAISANEEPAPQWSDIRGTIPYPLCGEDAQEWVSRTRREADEHREKQWRPSP